MDITPEKSPIADAELLVRVSEIKDALHAFDLDANRWLTVTVALVRERNQLYAALKESVKLQSHYAELLNISDGGDRIVFREAEDWLARLAVVG